MGEPTPAGRPVATHSMTPPTESLSALAAMMASVMRAAASPLMAGKSRPSASASICLARSAFASGELSATQKGSSATPAHSATWALTRMPWAESHCRQMPPATHRGPVRRPEKWPPPGMSWLPCHFAQAVKSAWPGRGTPMMLP